MLIRSLLAFAILCGTLLALTGAMKQAQSGMNDKQAIAETLDAFHTAASKADFDGYFAHFAPDGVFLGTDATERWTVAEFKAFAKPIFESGQGWSYAAVDGRRFITISDDGRTAWFDELLANTKYGMCRGSGVLRKSRDQWLIAQYNLALMIPNDKAKAVVALLKDAK